MIDKSEIEVRFRRSIHSYDENAFVQKLIIERLLTVCRTYFSFVPQKVLEIGCGTGLLTEKLCRDWEGAEIYVNDLVEEMCWRTAEKCGLPASHCLPGDIETFAWQTTFDVMISASAFQWLARPAQTFAQFAACLNTSGWLVFSSFGPDNYKELKAIIGNGLVYPSTKDLVRFLTPDFTILYHEEERQVLYFSDPVEILRHIKYTGVNALSGSRIWTKGKLQEFSQQYTARFLTAGSYPLTYHPVYFICRKKS